MDEIIAQIDNNPAQVSLVTQPITVQATGVPGPQGPAGPGGGAATTVATIADMKALAASPGDVIKLIQDGREGDFVFRSVTNYNQRYGGIPTLPAAVAADTLNGVFVAPNTDPSGNSGAWVRKSNTLTPRMFGAQTNYQTGNRSTMVPPYGESSTPGSTNAVLVDSRVQCQAMLDLMRLHENRRFIGDFSDGIWGISNRGDGIGLYINFPYYLPRRLKGGEFRGLLGEAGTDLIYVRDGGYTRMEGHWQISGGPDVGSGYGWNLRSWENGIHFYNSGPLRGDHLRCVSFLRYGVVFDILFDADPEDYNNNIGTRFQSIYCGACGSRGGTPSYEFVIGFTASNRSGSAGSYGQRTNLTLAATGTGGDSHTVIKVNDIILTAAGTRHIVLEKVGNVISVFPWIISQAASGSITGIFGGGIAMQGKDVAGCGADSFTAIGCAICMDISQVLHGTSWGQCIHEGSAIGVLAGTPNGIGGLGHTMAHMHSEGVILDLLAVGASNVGISIGSCGAWAEQDYEDPFKLCQTMVPNDGVNYDSASKTTGLPWLSIMLDGLWYETGSVFGLDSVTTKSRPVFGTLSNGPQVKSRLRKVVTAGTPINITLKYRESIDRCTRDNFGCRLEVVSETGGAPAPSITVTLDATDYAGGSGITFANGTTANTFVIAAGAATGPVVIDFWFDYVTNKWLVLNRSVTGGGSVSDGDKGDVVVSGSGATWNVESLSPADGQGILNGVAGSEAYFDINSPSGNRFAAMRSLKGAVVRWVVGADNTAEFSTAGGSDFAIVRYDNAGGFLGYAVTITRATGDVTIGGHMNLASGKEYRVNGTKVVGAQGAAVADATGGSTVDTEARAQLNLLLARLRAHGLIAT